MIPVEAATEAGVLAGPVRWRNWLTGAVPGRASHDESSMDAEELFAGNGGLPFVVLVSEEEDA